MFINPCKEKKVQSDGFLNSLHLNSIKVCVYMYMYYVILHCIVFLNSEITTIKLNSDQKDGIYYVGEDALLEADFENPSAVLYFKWQKEVVEKSNDIDTTSSKYTGSTCRPGIRRPQLMIRRCCFSDAGTYILMVTCKDVDIYSNEIHLKVKQGRI